MTHPLVVARALFSLAAELYLHLSLGRVSPERVRPAGTRSPSLPPLLDAPSAMEAEYGIRIPERAGGQRMTGSSQGARKIVAEPMPGPCTDRIEWRSEGHDMATALDKYLAFVRDVRVRERA